MSIGPFKITSLEEHELILIILKWLNKFLEPHDEVYFQSPPFILSYKSMPFEVGLIRRAEQLIELSSVIVLWCLQQRHSSEPKLHVCKAVTCTGALRHNRIPVWCLKDSLTLWIEFFMSKAMGCQRNKPTLYPVAIFWCSLFLQLGVFCTNFELFLHTTRYDTF